MEHPFMEKLSAWVESEYSFSGREALIGSELRQEENIRERERERSQGSFKLLKAVGHRKG
ncbi:hypothetical protein [Prochlorococcus sp. MIT 0801]|uniref:hypothetical protein n=1 Tax=Prochlorococcus sp. MIT 0801 TaxID=1501269 RepID=UPI0004F75141|nr:hypothetical protein [Prochlorococcus sp. MIT 0801]AIQ97819.1 hypothetical protein EW15_1727 [Prochlorococcus sp. MIT 0801]